MLGYSPDLQCHHPFGLKLGLLGLLAYKLTFKTIKSASGGTCRESESWAKDFVNNVKAVEQARDAVSS
jgi:hypothetical protein